MECFVRMVRLVGRYVFDIRVLYALTGIIVSIFAHELVHVLMHLGSINSVNFFPNLQTIVAMHVNFVEGYSVNMEEVVAYAVTVLIQFITVIDVLAIHDSRNKKTTEQLLLGSQDNLSERDRSFLLKLVSE